jgi:hypothetical protein
MHRRHTRYSADLQRFTMPDTKAPSGRWNRSLTKRVLRIRTGRRVLTRITFLMRLTFGALSLGSLLSTGLCQGPRRRAYPQPQGHISVVQGKFQASHLFVHVCILHQPVRSGDNQNGFDLEQSDFARPPAKFNQELVDRIKMHNLLRSGVIVRSAPFDGYVPGQPDNRRRAAD